MNYPLIKDNIWFLCHFDKTVKDHSGYELDTFIDETGNNEILRSDRNRTYGWSTFTETTGKFDKAFVSSNYSLEINDLSNFSANKFTVSFWAQNKGATSTNTNITTNFGIGYAFLILNLVGLRHYYGSLRIDDIMSNNKAWKNLSNDGWDHFAIQYNENKLYYYFNGDLYYTIDVTKSFTLDKIFFASALIDELMIYNGLLYDTDATVGTHVFDPPTKPYTVIHDYTLYTSVNADMPIISGSEITVFANLFDEDAGSIVDDGVEYLWNTGETTSSITVSPLVTTTYSVTVTHQGLTYHGTKTVDVITAPIVIINVSKTEINIGESVTIDASNSYCDGAEITSYLWSTGETTPMITVSPTVTTTYSVTVTASNGASSVGDVLIVVKFGEIDLMHYLPIYWHPNSEMIQIQKKSLNFLMYNLYENSNIITTEAYISTSHDARLSEWEWDLEIEKADDIETRRENILAFFHGKGKLNEEKIKSIVYFYYGTNCDVSIKDSNIHILIYPLNENDIDYSKVERDLYKKKPAHLGIWCDRYYYTWGEVKADYTDWGDMLSQRETWGKLKNYLPYLNN